MDLGVLKYFKGILVGNPITDLLVFLKSQKLLFHEGQGRPHECQTQKSEENTPTEAPKPLVKCPKCDPLSNTAWMKREALQEHLKVEHFGFW